MVNPFDMKTAILAKHAQHVVLIHFPIALFIATVAFDFIAQRSGRRSRVDATYYNLLWGSDINCSCSCYWTTCLAVSTRGTEVEGHLALARHSRRCFNNDDLAGVVGAFPCVTPDSSFARLFTDDRVSVRWCHRVYRALRRLPEWCKRT